MSYFSQYQNYYQTQMSERAGLNAYGPVACAFSIFGIVAMIIIFILVIPSYLLYLFHQKTTVDKSKLPKSADIQPEDMEGW